MSLLYFHCHFSIFPLRLLFPFLSCSSYSSPDVDHIVRMSPAVILHPLFAAAPPLFPGLTSLCCLITSLPPHISFLISHRCLSHATRVFLDKGLLLKTLQWEGKGLRLRGQRNLEGKKLPKMLFFSLQFLSNFLPVWILFIVLWGGWCGFGGPTDFLLLTA